MRPRRAHALISAAAILITLVFPVSCSSCIAPIMYEEDMTAIQNEYPQELTSIAAARGIPIHSIDEHTLPAIVETVNTVFSGQPRYDALLADIAAACARYDLYTSAIAANRRGKGRIENETIIPLTQNEWLCSKETMRIPAACTVTQNYGPAFSLSAGESIKNYPLSTGFTAAIGSPATMSGPPLGLILTAANGTQVYATHTVALSMLKGTLIRSEYDYVDNVTGARTHFTSIYVEDRTAYIQNVVTPASFGSSLVCVSHVSQPGVVRSFSYEETYHSMLKNDPTYFF